jgi:hypothetical protein
MGLSFTVSAGPRHRSHSRVGAPRDSWRYFTVPHSELPQPGGPCPRIYFPHEQGGPVIPPGTGFLFCHLLWLVELRWCYSNPPPHGVLNQPSQVTLRLAVYRQSVRLGVRPFESHDQRFFFQLNPCGNSAYVTSLTRRWIYLLWICLAFRQVYISHI